jgi:hypothetical protein
LAAIDQEADTWAKNMKSITITEAEAINNALDRLRD